MLLMFTAAAAVSLLQDDVPLHPGQAPAGIGREEAVQVLVKSELDSLLSEVRQVESCLEPHYAISVNAIHGMRYSC